MQKKHPGVQYLSQIIFANLNEKEMCSAAWLTNRYLDPSVFEPLKRILWTRGAQWWHSATEDEQRHREREIDLKTSQLQESLTDSENRLAKAMEEKSRVEEAMRKAEEEARTRGDDFPWRFYEEEPTSFMSGYVSWWFVQSSPEFSQARIS